MLLTLARSKSILFFGGKGGVGKTTVSAGTALAMAAEGRRVLIVSTDPAHNLGHLFNRDVGPRPVRLAPNLDGMELDPEETVNQHLEEVSGSLRKLMAPHLAGEVDKHIELSRDAPGMQEAALMRVREGVTSLEEVVRVFTPPAAKPAAAKPTAKPATPPAAGGTPPKPKA